MRQQLEGCYVDQERQNEDLNGGRADGKDPEPRYYENLNNILTIMVRMG